MPSINELQSELRKANADWSEMVSLACHRQGIIDRQAKELAAQQQEIERLRGERDKRLDDYEDEIHDLRERLAAAQPKGERVVDVEAFVAEVRKQVAAAIRRHLEPQGEPHERDAKRPADDRDQRSRDVLRDNNGEVPLPSDLQQPEQAVGGGGQVEVPASSVGEAQAVAPASPGFWETVRAYVADEEPRAPASPVREETSAEKAKRMGGEIREMVRSVDWGTAFDIPTKPSPVREGGWICKNCGRPTMHMGDECFECGKNESNRTRAIESEQKMFVMEKELAALRKQVEEGERLARACLWADSHQKAARVHPGYVVGVLNCVVWEMQDALAAFRSATPEPKEPA